MEDQNKTREKHYSALLQRVHPLTTDMQPIRWRDKATYQGVIIDKRLNFVEQSTSAIKKDKSSLGQLLPLLGYNSMNIHTKIQLYRTIIRPQIIYAADLRSVS